MLKLLFVVTCGLAVSIAQCKSFKFEDINLPCSGLPSNVRPTKYRIGLELPSLEVRDVSPRYWGQVDVSVEFLRDVSIKSKLSENVDHERSFKDSREVGCDIKADPRQIVLHADKDLDINEIKLYSKFCKFLFRRAVKITALLRDRSKQLIVIKLSRAIKNSGTLSIKFSGPIRGDKRGVYMFKSAEDKSIVSHLQPGEARLVFPCFDELRFKVPIELALNAEGDVNVIANTGIIRDKISGTYSAEITPSIPVHMFAFAVTTRHVDYQFINMAFKHRTLIREDIDERVKIIATSGPHHGFSYDVALHALNWFERYIDFKYPLSRLNLFVNSKLDKKLTTDSLGLVFLNEALSIQCRNEEPVRKIAFAVNIAYAVVCQWFGNMLSVNRLSDLWLTESVAAHFAIKIVQEIYPESDYFVRLTSLTSALEADQLGKLHPLSSSESDFWEQKSSRTSENVYEVFERLELMKSASLAQMLSDAVGADNYQAALRNLMSKHAYKTICYSDYAEALAKSVEGPSYGNVLRMLETFVRYRGVPLLDVIDRDGRLFLMPSANGLSGGEAQDLLMFVNSSLVDGMGSVTSTGRYLVSSKSHEIELPKLKDDGSLNFVKIDMNPSIRTYYRTRYTDSLLERLMIAVKTKSIGPMDRLHLLDDAKSLVTAGLMKIDAFSRLLDSYINENHEAVLLGMLTANKTLSQFTEVCSKAATRAIRSIYLDDRFNLARCTSPTMQYARQVVLTSLIDQGNQQVIEAVVKHYNKFPFESPSRDPVYTALMLTNSSRLLNLKKPRPNRVF